MPSTSTPQHSSADIAAMPASKTGSGAGKTAGSRTCRSLASPRTSLGGHQLVAGALIAWAQMICVDGELKKAEPKTIRYRLLHVAATLVQRRW